MTPNPAGSDTPLRRLLALEASPDPAFTAGVAALCGADGVLVLGPGDGADQRVTLASPLLDPDAAAAVAVDPAAHPLLFALGGRVELLTEDLAALPGADQFPGVRWCLAGVGQGWSFCLLCFGSGDPPRALAEDPLFGAQLLRLVAVRVGGGTLGPRAAAETLARLAHEFKTPLVSIKGYAELILDQDGGALDPRLRRWVARIAAGANRLAALFRKATAEARAADADAYQARPVDPAQWVRRCVEEARALAGARQLAWSWEVARDIPWALVDPEAAQDLLLELLQNAARATPDGGSVRVTAAAANRDLRPGVQVSVADDGVGFPAGDEGEALFGRFATLSPVLAHHSGEFEFGAAGLGLGLSMARGVARSHGGELWAEGRGRDAAGRPGAVFHLWLPVADPAGETAAGEPGAGRVLVLEPDPEARQILAAALGESYQVVAVATAAEARAAWAEGEWLGAILEPRVAGGGVALLQELRARPEARSAAILTYSTATLESTAWRAAGADSCVAKPARSRVLLQRLRTVTTRRTRR